MILLDTDVAVDILRNHPPAIDSAVTLVSEMHSDRGRGNRPMWSTMRSLKHPRLVLLALLALAVAGAVIWWRSCRADLLYAELESWGWDREAQSPTKVVVRIDDPHRLDQLRQWHAAARWDKQMRSLWRFTESRRRVQCSSTLRQLAGRVTLVYADGDRHVEPANTYRLPFREWLPDE